MDRRLPDRDQSVPQMIDGSHLTEDALEVYSLGRLSSEEDLATFEEHLLVCAYCQTRLEKVDQFVQAAASGARAVAEAQLAKKPLAFLPVAIAAAAAAIFFIPGALEQKPEPVEVALVAVRNESSFSAPAGKPLHIKPDWTGLNVSSLGWELSSVDGKLVRSGKLAASGRIAIAQLSAGQYWLRLRNPDSSELLREFSLVAR